MSLKYEALVDDRDAIPDDEVLFRRVSWQGIGGRERVPEGETARLTGNAFNDYSTEAAANRGYPGPCMSVAVRSILLANDEGPQTELEGHPDAGIAWIRAGDLRALTRRSGEPCPQGIMLAPEAGRPWHAVVFDLSGTRRGNPVKDAVSGVAQWEIPLVR